MNPTTIHTVRRMYAKNFGLLDISRQTGQSISRVKEVLGLAPVRDRTEKRRALDKLLRTMPADFPGSPEDYERCVRANFSDVM